MLRSRCTPNPNVVRAYYLLRYTGQCQSNVARTKAVPVRRHSAGSAPLIRLPAEVSPAGSDDPPYLVVDLGDVVVPCSICWRIISSSSGLKGRPSATHESGAARPP